MGKPGIIDLGLSYLVPDPLTDPTPVLLRTVDVLSGEDIMKSLRQYFPRTYEGLLEFEFMILSEIETSYLSPTQLTNMYDAIYEEGLGGLNTRSVMSMAGSIAGSWAYSILSDAFPNDADVTLSTPTRTSPRSTVPT
jgi:hypothetical protein